MTTTSETDETDIAGNIMTAAGAMIILRAIIQDLKSVAPLTVDQQSDSDLYMVELDNCVAWFMEQYDMDVNELEDYLSRKSFGDQLKKRIHINQHKIKSNKRNGSDDPVITVKTYKDNTYMSQANLVDEDGNVVAKIIYSPDKPLSCGATVWIETNLEVAESS